MAVLIGMSMTSCDDDAEGALGPPGPLVLITVTAVGYAQPVVAGAVLTLTAVATDAQSRVVPVPLGYEWFTSNSSIATVNSLGVVTPDTTGLVTITARTTGISGGLPIDYG